jgi:hypothetical protein
VWRHKNIKQDKLVQLFDITIYTSSSFSLIASSPNTTEEEDKEDKEDTKRSIAFVLLLCSVIVYR